MSYFLNDLAIDKSIRPRDRHQSSQSSSEKEIPQNAALRDENFTDSSLQSLLFLKINQEAEVVHIQAGFNATQRLSGLGITPGTRIQLLSTAPFRGPLQIKVRGTRLVIGRGIASRILVKSKKD
jgi:ferrous iron transport protein A